VSAAGRVLIERPCERADAVTVLTRDLPTGCRLDWEVITRNLYNRDERRAAGWFRVAPRDASVATAEADAEALFELGRWDDVVRRLWPRVHDRSLRPADRQMLIQLIRHEHEWLLHHCPGWTRLDRCGRALSSLDQGDPR
jgi:hypothetical protein